MAEQDKQTAELRKKRPCANCSKLTKRISFYYRNGNYFCTQSCFKIFDKKLKEEKQKKLEAERQKQEEAARKLSEQPAEQNAPANPPEPKAEQKEEQK